MDPLISPWLVYFVLSINAFKVFMCVTSVVLLGILSFVGFGFWIAAGDTPRREEELKENRELRSAFFIKKALITLPILLFSILIPNQKTVIAMFIADSITTNNISTASEIAGEFKDEVKEDVLDVLQVFFPVKVEDETEDIVSE